MVRQNLALVLFYEFQFNILNIFFCCYLFEEKQFWQMVMTFSPLALLLSYVDSLMT